jgi:hypothetical protein
LGERNASERLGWAWAAAFRLGLALQGVGNTTGVGSLVRACRVLSGEVGGQHPSWAEQLRVHPLVLGHSGDHGLNGRRWLQLWRKGKREGMYVEFRHLTGKKWLDQLAVVLDTHWFSAGGLPLKEAGSAGAPGVYAGVAVL